MSVSDYSPKRRQSDERKPRKPKWSQFFENFEHKNNAESTDSETPDNEKGFLDFHFLRNIDFFERNVPSTSSLKVTSGPKRKNTPTSKSLASSPKLDAKRSLLRCFEIPQLPITLGEKPAKVPKEKASPTTFLEENFSKFLPKRRTSTPCVLKGLPQKRISDLRESGAKTDSENDDGSLFTKRAFERRQKRPRSQLGCITPESILITTTAPSGEVHGKYSSSSTDGVGDYEMYRWVLCVTQYSVNDYSLVTTFVCETRRKNRIETICSYVPKVIRIGIEY